MRTECLVDALDNKTEYGVWGGMTERERRKMLRAHPEVTSWRQLFDAALKRHEAQQQATIAPALGDRALHATKPLPPQPSSDPIF